MILTALFSWFMSIFSMVEPIEIPQLVTILEYFDLGVNLVVNGVSFLGLFIGDTGLFALSVYLVFVLALEMFYLTYQISWFVIKKIPMVNIDP